MYRMVPTYLTLMLLFLTTLSTEGQIRNLNTSSYLHSPAQNFKMLTNDQKICSNGTCYTMKEETMNTYYKGLFHSRADIKRLRVELASKRREEFKKSALNAPIRSICRRFKRNKICQLLRTRNQDYDLCCPTKIDNSDSDWMHNIAGELKMIAHLKNPERRQFIPEASCVSNGSCFEGFGVCQVEKISMWLLVFDLSCFPPVKFDQFSIPAYCSCKSK